MARQKLYKNLKLSERMILFIKTLGWEETTSANKYRMFRKMVKEKTGEETERFLFLGKNGGVRMNNKKNASTSFSMTDQFLRALTEYEVKNNLHEIPGL